MRRAARQSLAGSRRVSVWMLLSAVLPIWLSAGCSAIDQARAQISERFSGKDSATPADAAAGAVPQSLSAPTQRVKTESPSTLLQIEQRLVELGYDPGPVDGRLTSRTEAAIQDFQLDNDLRIDGKPTESLLKILRAKSKKSS